MLKLLLDQLQSPDPQARIEALSACTMLEETQVLDLLAQMWAMERDTEVKQMVGWAGTQINAAKQRGYSTSVAMAQVFRYDLGLANEQEEEEQRKLKQLQQNVSLEQAKQFGISESG